MNNKFLIIALAVILLVIIVAVVTMKGGEAPAKEITPGEVSSESSLPKPPAFPE